MVQNTGTRLKSQTVWPSINSKHKKQPSAIQLPPRNIEEEEDYVSVPSYSQNLGDALAVALQQNKLGEFIHYIRLFTKTFLILINNIRCKLSYL